MAHPHLRFDALDPMTLRHVYLEAELEDESDRTWHAPIDPARPRVAHWPLTGGASNLDRLARTAAAAADPGPPSPDGRPKP